MSQPDKKLEKFHSAVLKDAQEQRDAILAEIEQYRASEMEKAEEDILQEAYVLIQSEIAAIKNRQSRQISLAELEGRRKLLKLREDLTQKVFDETAEKVLAFTKTAEYKDYLCKAVAGSCSGVPEGALLIEVRHDDLPFAEDLRAASGRQADVRENPDILLGGVIVYNRDKGLVIDETLDLKLSSQRDWFAANSGLSIGL
jgi:V/A-type H+-transporting ATPase subunit E